jgi:hypothetical protein
LEQVKLYGGLADKSNETKEKRHQALKVLRECLRGNMSFEHKEACVRRELRRSRSTEIKEIIDNYNALIKREDGTKRAIDISERQDNKKKAQQKKRDSFIAN